MNLLQRTLLLSLSLHTTHSQDEDNWCPPDYSGFMAGPGCISYVICNAGVQSGTGMPCQPGTLFNEDLSLCDFEENVNCETTALPTQRPTRPPTVPPTPRIEPTTPSPTLPPNTRSPSSNVGVEDALDNAQWDLNNKIVLYESGFEGGWLPSTVYRYDTMLKALQLMYLEGVGDMRFYMGEDVHGVEGVKVALVNLAAFLAQSMKETIKYNACDENNWDLIEGKYPLSNACGQLEQSYQDYNCPEGMEHMQCEVDPNMELKATTTAMWYGAPGPLFCGPKTKYPFVGYWDYSFQCDYPWKDPPELCPDYPGQKGGRYDNSEPVENRNNRTDVEGCCWWGRGVIQTTGICNFGILNYYIGKRAADEGRDSRYPHLDFCKDPGLICSREDHKELKWIAGFFYWMKSVQTYDNGWSYIDNLKRFVSGGMEDDTFIDAVSGIVNRGCHNPPCGTGSLDGGSERKENFKKVLSVLFEENGDPRVRRPTESPTISDSLELPPLPPDDTTTEEIDSDSSRETDYVSEITANEDEAEEWVDNEEDWSDVSSEEEDSSGESDKDETAGEEESGSDTSYLSLGDEEAEEEEDWSNIDSDGNSTNNLFCGKNQKDATRNCDVEGNACPDGICSGDLKCYMVSECGSGSEEDTDIPSPPDDIPTDDMDSTSPTAITLSPAESLTSPSPVSTESEDSPSGGFDIKNTFFCGVDRADAATMCSKRCRSGSNDECPTGQACFGYTPCPMEIGTDESLTSMDDTEAPIVSALIDSPSPIALPSPADTRSPSSVNNLGKTQNYCAKSLNELPTVCVTAITCNDGEPDCPSGTYCWGDRLCGDVAIDDDSPEPTLAPSLVFLETESPVLLETLSPSEAPALLTQSPIAQLETSAPAAEDENTQQLLCAATMQELETSCSTAQSCASGPCPKGTFCFPFECNNSSVPLPVPVATQPPTMELTPQLFCATSIDELETSCSIAQECSTGPCPPGTFCFPFDCGSSTENQISGKSQMPTGSPSILRVQTKQPTEVASTNDSAEKLCPPTYTGWISLDCFEYWECTDGLAGPIRTCPEGMKFDKVISECNLGELVNNFCYGPPPNAQDEQAPIESLPEDANASAQPESASQEGKTCKGGRSGWEAAEGCREYYWCDNGSMSGVLHDCGENLLFDSKLELCNFADQVTCNDSEHNGDENVVQPQSQPQPPPLPAPLPLATQPPVSNGQSDLASNDTATDNNIWPSSTTPPTSKAGDDKDLPPWLVHVVKGSDSESSANNMASQSAIRLLLVLMTAFQLDLL